ncbi:DUF3558 domain-containing protein [Nocardia sp. SYP-A9097]|uniref:DUF3558 domain-containing protein n=1 Tax=Nocardia sp. SYP-A9097 TaxID=2663237 RepID=UPI00129A9D70|nr:DUF3558 domain-containing protein [Nocardia sp. SYP-A9097]MRH87899.1 DUF3558 domain-containing protein [Nocardia sp. SYP-A9097]
MCRSETDTAGSKVTFKWFRGSAVDLGYQLENFVTKSFGGFYWHDPRDPGSCGASAAYSGTVTWWVRRRGSTAQSETCSAAWQLIFDTVELDG